MSALLTRLVCKQKTKRLTRPDNLNQLVASVVELPSDDLDERQRFKSASIACELLTSDVSAINDALVSDAHVMDKLYSFVQADAELNPLMASYFAKVIGCLITRKTENFLEYMQTKEDFIELFLRHVNTSAILDIILRLLTTIDSNEQRLRSIVWLKSIRLIARLTGLFHHELPAQIHSNVSQLMCDIIRISREQILSHRENQMHEMTSMQMGRPSFANDIYASSSSSCDSSSRDASDKLSDIKELHSTSLLEDIEA